jgi:hypothetical protein
MKTVYFAFPVAVLLVLTLMFFCWSDDDCVVVLTVHKSAIEPDGAGHRTVIVDTEGNERSFPGHYGFVAGEQYKLTFGRTGKLKEAWNLADQ